MSWIYFGPKISWKEKYKQQNNLILYTENSFLSLFRYKADPKPKSYKLFRLGIYLILLEYENLQELFLHLCVSLM